MKLNDILNETPEIIEPIGGDFSIENPKRNRSLYDDVMYKPHELIKDINKSIKLVYCKRNEEDFKFQYVCLDIENKYVPFISRIDIDNNSVLGKYVFQSLLWMDDGYKQYLNGLPTKLIFNILLPKYRTVTTDGTHTMRGMKYWARLIDMALNKNINVYYFNKKSKLVIKILSLNHLYQLQTHYKIWDRSDSAQNKIIVLTTKELKETSQ